MKFRSGSLDILASAFVVAMFGSMAFAVSTVFDNRTQVAIRSAIAVAAALFFAFSMRSRLGLDNGALLPVDVRADRRYIVFAGVGMLFSIICLTAAVQRIGVGEASFFIFVSQVYVSAFIAPGKLKEFSLAACVAFVGLMFYLGGIVHFDIGMVYAAFAGASNAGANWSRKKIHSSNTNTIVAYQSMVGTVIAIGWCVMQPPHVTIPAPKLFVVACVTLLLYGAITYAMGVFLFTGYKVGGLSLATGSVISSTQIVWATGLGLLFKQIPSPAQIVGCGLIAVAGFLAMRQPQPKEEVRRPQEHHSFAVLSRS